MSGKGSTRRKGADDAKYSDGWDRIFGNKDRRDEGDTHRSGTGGDAEKQDSDSDVPKTGR